MLLWHLILELLLISYWHAEAKLWDEIHRLEQMRQHIIQLNVELLLFVLCIRIVHFSDLAEEVKEFGILKLIHALTLTHSVDHSHETLSEDDA